MVKLVRVGQEHGICGEASRQGAADRKLWKPRLQRDAPSWGWPPEWATASSSLPGSSRVGVGQRPCRPDALHTQCWGARCSGPRGRELRSGTHPLHRLPNTPGAAARSAPCSQTGLEGSSTDLPGQKRRPSDSGRRCSMQTLNSTKKRVGGQATPPSRNPMWGTSGGCWMGKAGGGLGGQSGRGPPCVRQAPERTCRATWFLARAALCRAVIPSLARKSRWAPPFLRALITSTGSSS